MLMALAKTLGTLFYALWISAFIVAVPALVLHLDDDGIGLATRIVVAVAMIVALNHSRRYWR
jgi:hypothetical protein